MKSKILHIIFAVLFFHFITGGNAQQNIQVKNATGSCIIANISPEKAKEEALFNAKVDALRKAGIPENVLANVTKMGEFFLETSTAEIGGGVIGYDIVDEDIKIVTPEGERSKILIVEIIINANVIKYDKEKDPSFQLQVQGIKKVYGNNETLTFSVTPYQNGYLRIFFFDEDGLGEQIYPDKKLEPNELFLHDETINFPKNDQYYYVLKLTDKTKPKEINRMLFIFLKDNIHYTENKATMHSVLNWAAKISPDRRTQEFREFIIEL